MASGESSQLQSVVVFGVSGLGAGIVSAELISRFIPPPDGRHAGHGPYLLFFWPGALFLVALVGSFQLCRNASWPRFANRPWRSILAAVLVSANTFTSICAALFVGVAAAALVGSPSSGGPPPGSHSWLFYATPVVTAVVSGGLVSASMLAVALFIFSEIWDPEAWARLVQSNIVATIVTVAINPKILLTLQYSSAGQTDNSPLLGMLTFLVCDFMFCGACAGYWITRASRAHSISSPGLSD